MTAQYWVGDFFVDLTRNQITQKTESQTIPPKALAVLTHLAKNANKVVSQDELLDRVWPDTIVTPNTLQRSIAQLRKALGEDRQYQTYIKTHAKQGYSLEVEVRWQDKADSTTPNSSQEKVVNVNDSNSDTATASKPELSMSGLRLISIVAGIVILGIIGYTYLSPTEPTSPLTFDKLSSITATDDKEYDASYTPDGKLHRFPSLFR